MLSRYQMKRGTPASQLPHGIRQDTRKHTHHIVRPEAEWVEAFLHGRMSHSEFASRYSKRLHARFAEDRAPFDELAELARTNDVFLGCSCPTAAVPDVRHCHTWHALEFMAKTYPDLDVRFPASPSR